MNIFEFDLLEKSQVQKNKFKCDFCDKTTHCSGRRLRS